MSRLNVVPQLDALVAQLRAAGCVFAEDEAELLLADSRVVNPSSPPGVRADILDGLVSRRVAGEPLETVLGWAEFCGLRIEVGGGVFVPRRRSELLVSAALRLIAADTATVVELCCGSGAISAALLARHPSLDLYASDIDEGTVAFAQRNLRPRGGKVFRGDLFDALPGSLRHSIDVVVVNAPYVPTDQIDFMPPEARDWEPTVALDGGSDGLEIHRRIFAASGNWLRQGGTVVIETSEMQSDQDVRLAAAAGLTAHAEHDDDLDATVVFATLKTAG